jgi:hypothetical protein
MTAPRNLLAVLTVAIISSLSTSQLSAKPPTKTEIQAANKLALKLVSIDSTARAQFAKEHPGVLPEQILKLPKADATAFDWTNLNKVSEAHRQLTGDCWANSATEALECSELIRNNRRIILSPQPILDVLKSGASESEMAAQPYKACDFFMKNGIARNATYPYSGKPSAALDVKLPYRAVAWGFISQADGSAPTNAQIKAGLLKHGPLVVDLTVSKKFTAYKGGLHDEQKIEKDDNEGQHAVLLVGWDDARGPHGAWKIKNTWGPKWGEQGFIWLAYGSNSVAGHVEWVMAESTYYNIPQEAFAQLVPDAKPLPVAHYKVAKAEASTHGSPVTEKATEKSEEKTATSIKPSHTADLAVTNSNQ